MIPTLGSLLLGWLAGKMLDLLMSAQPVAAPAYTPRGAQPRAPTRARRPAAATAAPASSASPAPPIVTPVSTAPPWPQVMPSGLPPFPGAGWEPDQPPPSAVVVRANELLSPLWSGGAGTWKVEKTAGRWIVYRAVPMGTKHGVVAYRESAHAAFLSPAPSATAPAPTLNGKRARCSPGLTERGQSAHVAPRVTWQ